MCCTKDSKIHHYRNITNVLIPCSGFAGSVAIVWHGQFRLFTVAAMAKTDEDVGSFSTSESWGEAYLSPALWTGLLPRLPPPGVE